MLKMMLQLGLLAAAVGMAKTSYDNGSLSLANGLDLQPVIAMIEKFSDKAKTSGIPGSKDAATGADTIISSIKNLDITKPETTNAQGETTTPASKNSVPHAFYKSTPEKCAGELVIDFQTGVATCPQEKSR